MDAIEDKKLIDLNLIPDNRFGKVLQQGIENILSVKELNDTYKRIDRRENAQEFLEDVLKHCRIKFDIAEQMLAKIPETGGVVTVSNHPFGGVEGIIMSALLMRKRSDVRILGNSLLQQIDEIKDIIIPVDPFGHKTSSRFNSRGLREAVRWVKNGGVLVTFPSGEVSSFDVKKGRVTDPEWAPHIASISRMAKVDVLPVYFPGRNSTAFQLLGLIHPRFRTALLPKELMNKQDKSIEIQVGSVISAAKIASFEDSQDTTDYLRLKTYVLENCRQKKQPEKPVFTCEDSMDPIIAPVDVQLLEDEIAALSQEHLFAEQRDLQVFIARNHEIPHMMTEIGRLREVTFRAAKEGTGKSCDLDQYDEYYLQLFMWNKKEKELVGAYRLGLVDEIVEKYGRKGLYTYSLFKFKKALLKEMGCSMELGRSFIRQEYQRKPTCLAMLWKGICTFSARNPQYRNLFGPVSISQDYSNVSRTLMIQYLKETRYDDNLAKYVKARQPYRSFPVKAVDKKRLGEKLKDINEVSMMISELEDDGKGIPVLIKHYLKLNAKLLSFNVDKDFANVVDGLILVDLMNSGERFLNKFMGPDGREAFCHYHSCPAES